MPEGRDRPEGGNCKTHWNLNRKDWSVFFGQDKVKHYASLVLENVRFRVWDGGRKRVLLTGVRMVHAFATGEFVMGPFKKNDLPTMEAGRSFVEVSYNPFRNPFFYRKDTGEEVWAAKKSFFSEDGRLYVNL